MEDDTQKLQQDEIAQLKQQVNELLKEKKRLVQENAEHKCIIQQLKQDIAEIGGTNDCNTIKNNDSTQQQQQENGLKMIFELLLSQIKNTINNEYETSNNRLFLYQLNQQLNSENQQSLQIFLSQIIFNCIQTIVKPIFTIDNILKLPQLLFKQKLSCYKTYSFDFNIFNLKEQGLFQLKQIFTNNVGKSTIMITVPENGILVNRSKKDIVQSFHTIDQMVNKYNENKDMYQEQIDLILIQNFQSINFKKLNDFDIRHMQIMNTLGSITNFNQWSHQGSLQSLTIIGCNGIELSAMKNLKSLCICSSDVKFDIIQKLDNLEHLYIQNQDQQINIESYLKELKKMKTLTIIDCQISDISLTFECETLEQLQLRDCKGANFINIELNHYPKLWYLDVDQINLQHVGESKQQFLIKAQNKWVRDDLQAKMQQQ